MAGALGSSGGQGTGGAPPLSPGDPEFITDEEAQRLRGSIDHVTVSGDFCPPTTYAIAAIPDKVAVGITFSNAIGGDTQGTAPSCTVEADISVPEGYEISRVPVRLAGDGSHATLTRTYRFSEAGAPRAFRDSFDTGTFTLADLPDLPSSSSCEPSKRVHMMVLLEPTVSADDGGFQMDSLDIETVWRNGAGWRRCGQMNPLQLPPGNAGDFCNGFPRRPCADGLVCEYRDPSTPTQEGTCVNPKEVVPPQAEGKACGGVRNIPCQSGLVCWFSSQTAVDHADLGWCSHTVANEEDSCNQGVPPIPCDGSYYCQLDRRKCVSADGEDESWCGDGLPPCKAGLRCGGTYRCVAPRDQADASP